MLLPWMIAALFAALVLFLLFTPVVVQVDTVLERYEVRWAGVGIRVLPGPDGIAYRFTAPFFQREGTLLPAKARPVGPAPKGPRAPRSTHAPRLRPLHLLPALLRTFRVRRWHWTLDTGDAIWNAWLFPLAHLARSRGHDVCISFTGGDRFTLVLHNNLYRVLKAVLHSSHQRPNTRTS